MAQIRMSAGEIVHTMPPCPAGGTTLTIYHGGWQVHVFPSDKKKWLTVAIEVMDAAHSPLRSWFRLKNRFVRRMVYRDALLDLANRMLLGAMTEDWQFVPTKRQRKSFSPPTERTPR